MKLAALLETLDYQLLCGTLDTEVTHIETDSRHLAPGGLFIALKGYTQDGHDYIPELIEKGCRHFCLENEDKFNPAWSLQYSDLVCVCVKESAKAQAVISSRFYGMPSEEFTLIGITGTNGKTSIAQLLGSCLKGLNKTTGILGTTGNRIGDRFYETSNTTLEAVKLQRLFREMADYPVDYGIMEVSSHALKLGRVEETSFDYAVFTNLTEDHMDFHPDLKDYYETKRQLFYKAKKASVINMDDPHGKELFLEQLREGRQAYSYGLSDGCDFYADNIEMSATSSTFTARFPGESVTVKVPIPGKIYIYNALAVLSVLYLLQFELDEMAEAMAGTAPVEGRLEIVPTDAPGTVIVDYAHTPDALEKVIQVCKEFTSGRVITVFGCGGDRDKTKRPVMGGIASSLSDYVIVTSDNPRTEDPEVIISEIFKGIHSDDLSKVSRATDRRLAIEKGIAMLEAQDTLLIAGKGHETYQIIGKTKNHFDDREEAKSAALAQRHKD